MKTEDLSWGVLLMAVLGILVAMFAINAACWYLAHHFGWWTYGILGAASEFAWLLGKAIIKELRNR